MLISLFKNSNVQNKNLLIYGEDAFLNDYLIRDYLNNSEFKGLDLQRIDCENDGLDELLASLTEASLFSQQKIIWVKNPIFLTGKSPKKLQANIAKLEKVFANLTLSDDIVIMQANYANLDKRKKITKLSLSAFNSVEVQFKPYEVSGVIKAIIKDEGYSIAQNTLHLLLERSDQVMDTALSNYLKLKLIADDNKKITLESVQNNVDLSLAQNIFEILSSAFKKNYQESLERLEDQLREGQNPVRILSVFENQLEVILSAKILLARKRSEMDIGKELGIHPYRVKLAKQIQVSVSKLKRLLLEAIKLDQGYKNGTYQGDEFIKMFLLAI